MLKFLDFPPAKPGDVAFSPVTLEQLEVAERKKTKITKIGTRIGGCLITNVEDNDFATAMGLANQLCLSGEGDVLEWDDRIAFMQGAVKGMLEELASLEELERSRG
jgi:hypothetical protein